MTAARQCVFVLLLVMAGDSVGYGDDLQYSSPDGEGLWRDTRYFVGYQFAAIGVLYAMSESVTGWSDEQKSEYSLSIWWDNVRHPSWDSDSHFINYVTHPYWGAAYFVRARERGYDERQASWYSAALSTTYEFGAEAIFEEPSIQDLIVTPVLGSLLGKYFVEIRYDIQSASSARGFETTKEKWVMTLTDPLGALNRRVREALGRETDLQICPYYSRRSQTAGLQVELRW